MRVYVATLVAALAIATVLLRSREQTPAATIEEQSEPLETSRPPPPPLAGAARSRALDELAPLLATDRAARSYGFRRGRAGAPLSQVHSVPLSWTLDVVDESGSAVDPMGLISVVIRNQNGSTFESVISGASIQIAEVYSDDTVTINRNFPQRVAGSEAFGEDTAEVRASSRLVRVVLGGWTPVRVILRERDPGRVSKCFDYFEIDYSGDGTDVFRRESSASHALPVRFRKRVLVARWARDDPDGPIESGGLDVVSNPAVFASTENLGR